jgi:hypothetical protein
MPWPAWDGTTALMAALAIALVCLTILLWVG